MPLRHLVVAHHRFPDMKLEVTEILHPCMVKTRKGCVTCRFYVDTPGAYGECRHPDHEWVIPKELAVQPFPCTDWKPKKPKTKKRRNR